MIGSPFKRRKQSFVGTQYENYFHTLTVIVELKPGLVDYFVTATARLRWDEANELPQTRVRIPP